MSKRDWKILLQDILESIEKIEKYTLDMDDEGFSKSSITIDAVVRNIEIIGEASTKISKEIQSNYSTVPWEQLRGIRNRIVQEYFGVDVSIIWKIVKTDLPDLRKRIELIMQES